MEIGKQVKGLLAELKTQTEEAEKTRKVKGVQQLLARHLVTRQMRPVVSGAFTVTPHDVGQPPSTPPPSENQATPESPMADMPAASSNSRTKEAFIQEFSSKQKV